LRQLWTRTSRQRLFLMVTTVRREARHDPGKRSTRWMRRFVFAKGRFGLACAAGLVLALAFLGFAAPAGAVSFSGTQTGPTEWAYTLTYDPLDNYAVCPAPGNIATITLSGLAGVVSATAPTSTDYDNNPFLDALNLLWTPQVSNGGTVVTWTHFGSGGTGNFPIQKHVFGFKVFTAAPAVSGTINVASNGFSLDVSVTGPCPVQPADDRDFAGTTQGPASIPDTTPPVLSVPATIVVRAPKKAKSMRVNYTVTARDDVDGAVPVICKPRSGSRFKIGRTKVTCRASDTSGNTQTATFNITVKRR
jgi:HYR domain-containing protein